MGRGTGGAAGGIGEVGVSTEGVGGAGRSEVLQECWKEERVGLGDA